jgi:hypothetical protein
VRLRSLSFVVAMAVAAVVGLGETRAAIIVSTASGNIGNFNAVNEGVVGNTATILFNIPQVSAQINTVNGGVVVPPETVMVNTPLTLLVTSLGAGNYTLALSPPSAKEIVGANVGAQAILDFGLQTGTTTTVLPAFFNASGRITGLEANLDPNLDFQKFGSPSGGTINFTLTATTFGGTGVTSFDTFFATAGATAVGNGSFSEVAVPEPSTYALSAITVVGAAVYRRWRKRSRKA